ncbi:MAG: hypothetical protein KGI54_08445 [Pseudomonadota bacterium]|nr:hypothetical protein [Pseudomonadota bacterium]
MRPNVIDQINNSTADEVVQASFGILDSLQNLNPPGIRLPAIAILFLLLCKRFNINSPELLSKSGRMLNDSLLQGKGEHVRAIRQYLDNEM